MERPEKTLDRNEILELGEMMGKRLSDLSPMQIKTLLSGLAKNYDRPMPTRDEAVQMKRDLIESLNEIIRDHHLLLDNLWEDKGYIAFVSMLQKTIDCVKEDLGTLVNGVDKNTNK